MGVVESQVMTIRLISRIWGISEIGLPWSVQCREMRNCDMQQIPESLGREVIG